MCDYRSCSSIRCRRSSDSAIQRLDILAGAAIARMVAAERLAQKSGVLVDQATLGLIGTEATVEEWREETEPFPATESDKE